MPKIAFIVGLILGLMVFFMVFFVKGLRAEDNVTDRLLCLDCTYIFTKIFMGTHDR